MTDHFYIFDPHKSLYMRETKSGIEWVAEKMQASPLSEIAAEKLINDTPAFAQCLTEYAYTSWRRKQ